MLCLCMAIRDLLRLFCASSSYTACQDARKPSRPHRSFLPERRLHPLARPAGEARR
jgi:hypothetical protein